MRVHTELGGQLETCDGLISQLYATTRLLLRVEQGDYSGMAIPLHRSAERVIERLAASPRRWADGAGTGPGRSGIRGSARLDQLRHS